MAPDPRRSGRVAVLVALTTALSAGVAQAHPFGDPQTARISSDGDTVHVRWRAAPDDLSALAIELRAVESGRTFVYENGALVPEESDPSDVEALAGAPAFEDYLLRHITVRAGGQECPGTVGPLDALADDGAGVTFTCAAPVTAAEVSISTLTDLHEAYRTLAVGPDDQGAVYTLDDDTAAWTFDPAVATTADGIGASRARAAVVQVSAAVAVAGAAAVVTLLVRRRRPAQAPDGVDTGHPHS